MPPAHEAGSDMDEAPDLGPGACHTCARGELNRETFTLDQAELALLSVKPASRYLRFPPVTPGACTPGVHQPACPVDPTSTAGRPP